MQLVALRLQIGDPTRRDFSVSEVERALNVWEQVEEFFGAATKPDIVFDSVGDKACEVHIDAFPMAEYLRVLRTKAVRAAGGKGSLFESEQWRNDPSAAHRPELRLRVTATKGPRIPYREINGYLGQLFHVVNITAPGTCDFKSSEYVDAGSERAPIKFRSDPLGSAYLYARDTGWPDLAKVTFAETWKWLRGRRDDPTPAITPSGVALYALYTICIQEWGHRENVSVLARGFDSLLGAEKAERLDRVVQKLERIIGAPLEGSKWFSDFYALRNRNSKSSAMHSDTVVLWRAIGAMLAMLQDMVLRGVYEYEFESAP